ncbi:hypothetical protein ACFZB9_18935 [Kitasatospora sp. NPDC008050]|uniref:hypothetical protein n=1 Tax=Kitasatospora sp. NPDC008050 TaxID=3364021 RepID=UPI0036EF06C9
MNKTRLTEEFAVRPPLAGGLAVLTAFRHPRRGRVSCPAAPLVAAWLRRRSSGVRLTGYAPDLGGAGAVDQPVGCGRVFTISYLDESDHAGHADHAGRAVGIAVHAAPGLLEIGASAVRAWSAALRTRRLFLPVSGGARTSGPCTSGPCTSGPCTSGPCGGEPGAREPGVGDPGAGGPWAAGPGPAWPTQSAAARPSAAEPAAPCPHATATWRTVHGFLARGDTVLLLGTGAGGTATGPLSPVGAAGLVLAVRTVAAAHHITVPDPDRLSFAQLPCSATEEIAAILAVLRARFPRLRGQHPDQWCYAASDTRAAVRAAMAESDLTLVLPHGAAGGSAWYPPGRRLHLGELGDLVPEVLAPAATLTLLPPSGHAVRSPGPEEVIEALSGLGPLSVVRRGMVSETTRSTSSTAAETGATVPR